MAALDNAAVARELYELFNQGQLDRAVNLASDDVEVELVPFGQTFQGRDGFMAFMKGFKDAFPDLQVTVTNQVASEDQVVSECTWTGTHSGTLATPTGGVPPTGKTVTDGRFCEVWRLRDGKVMRLVNYQDAASWLRQLGLVG